ncbi:hypothetical protein G6N82_01755 [Altererythrobacter sp. BO-6]|uniref:hypothetical protein n=1 Tax=Altererythrobacter sp. BO-6 TaxID=2604537 RepID=UPI0013E1783B|nr:hypothetical protein [Altererythrobacter sp. BO-6]QIG53053.1 hypothetical protein G6N82_01755 [Altererythrobacter sp. BO-6]
MSDGRMVGGVVAGWLVAGASVLAFVLMANHPSGGDYGTIWTPIVHGGLLFFMLLQTAGMLAIWRELDERLPATIGLVAFVAGQAGGMIAGTINGFVVPGLWRYPEAEIGRDIGRLAWEMNQSFAMLGAVSTGISFALFGVALWRMGWHWVAGLGVLVGTATAFHLASGMIGMDLHGALLTYLPQIAWLVLFGAAAARPR